MALSNSQYDAVMRGYQRQQLRNKRELDERLEEVYKHIPAIKELEDMIGTTAVSCAKRLLDGNQDALEELREEIADLKEQKKLLLKAGGFEADVMEMHYRCPDCRDTGYQDGKKCHCFRQEEMKLLYAQSNIDEILKRENFTTYSDQYYDGQTVVPAIGKTVADYMRQKVEQCREFAARFDRERGNLLFTGATGVGKTFLSNCIAKALIDRYFSVIYLSAEDLFNVFSKNRFEYQAEEEMKDICQYVLDCDLLIIDDLGTELNNSFVSSQLFYCMNERLKSGKSTIISTNLSMNELRDRYTERVTSRIISSYTVIPLYGADIRYQIKLRKGQR